jgi:6-pyruvoyltetrahydropterin/6-carboxytetrahydropterin synthase
MEDYKIFRFEASHILPRHPGKCSRLHGHSWVLKVSVSGEINEDTGFVMDFYDINRSVGSVIDRLDHHHLGQWEFLEGNLPTSKRMEDVIQHKVLDMDVSFYPSSENLIVWIAGQLGWPDPCIPWSRLELNETCTSGCILTREEYERTVRSRSGSMEKA